MFTFKNLFLTSSLKEAERDVTLIIWAMALRNELSKNATINIMIVKPYND